MVHDFALCIILVHLAGPYLSERHQLMHYFGYIGYRVPGH